MRYFINLSYCGAPYNGWQSQTNAPSVQQTIERALSTLLREEIKITGAGRTDTGVNAIGYTAHFDASSEFDCAHVGYKLNAILPPSIVIHKLFPVSHDAHARFCAINREYTYFLHRVKDPFLCSYSYLYAYPELDFDLMNKAARLLLGTHDFRCFEKSGADNKTSICTISKAYWESYIPTPCGWPERAENEPLYWKFHIGADRFLRNMVRAVVGTLLEVGRGKRSIESFEALILPADYNQKHPEEKNSRRSLAGESVPGEALFLTKVDY